MKNGNGQKVHTSKWTGLSTSMLHNSATVDFNMSKSKSLEKGESLVRSYGSHVSCLCLTCGSVPSVALSVLCWCHGWLYSDTCSACWACVTDIKMWMWEVFVLTHSNQPNISREDGRVCFVCQLERLAKDRGWDQRHKGRPVWRH